MELPKAPKLVKYVVGFAFAKYHTWHERESVSDIGRLVDYVLLIRKARPAWMKDLLNGVGGHVEENEMQNPVNAMVREFKEETDIDTLASDWREFVVLTVDNTINELATLHCFSLQPTIPSAEVNRILKGSPTDELLGWWEVNRLPSDMVPNTKWLIPMALDRDIISGSIRSNQVKRG